MNTRLPVLVLLTAVVAVAIPNGPAHAAPTCGGLTATVVGTSGGDHLVGTAGRDVFWAGDGHDTIVAIAGDDLICPGFGFDRIVGGLGFDVVDYSGQGTPPDRGVQTSLEHGVALVPTNDLLGTEVDAYAGIDGVIGTAAADILLGGPLANKFMGLGGNDILQGFQGDDYLDGGDGDDLLLANAPEQVDPNTEAPPIDPAIDDDDTLLGGNGNDTLLATLDNASVNRMFGGAGNDVLKAYAGQDHLDGGSGVDTVTYAGHAFDLVIDLAIVGCQETGQGCDSFSGIENLVGGNGADTLRGGGVNNEIDGGPGDDSIDGGPGIDTAIGDSGTDTCVAESRILCEI